MRTPLTLALTLLLAGPAAAAVPLPPADLTPPVADGPQSAACAPGDRQPGVTGTGLAVNAAGDAVVAWSRNAGPGLQVVQARVRPSGGTFGPAEDLGPTIGCAFVGIVGPEPQVAIDGDGDVTVAWLARAANGNQVIAAAQRPAGGGFGTPVNLSDDARGARGDLALDVAADGGAIAAWSRSDGTRFRVQAAIRPAGGAFAPATELSTASQNADGPAVAIADGGALAAAWNQETAGSGSVRRVHATVRPAGAANFVAPQPLSPAESSAIETRAGIERSGGAIVAWRRPAGQRTLAEAATLTPQGAATGGVDVLNEPGEDARSALALAVTPGGRALAGYVGCAAGGTCAVKAADGRRGAPFQTPAVVSPPVEPDARIALALGEDGDAAVAVAKRLTAGRLLVAHRAAGGEFADVVPISPEGAGAFGPSLALAPQGDVLAAWTLAGDPLGGPRRAQAGGLDLPGPPLPPAAPAPPGAAPPPGDPPAAGPAVVRSPVQSRWAVKGRRLVLLSLRVAQPPARASARLRCQGRACPFRARSQSRGPQARGPLVVFAPRRIGRALDVRARRFRAGQTLELRVTAPGRIGKVVRFRLRGGRVPEGEVACLPPGARAPEACPQ